jgi:hypothetical protein
MDQMMCCAALATFGQPKRETTTAFLAKRYDQAPITSTLTPTFSPEFDIFARRKSLKSQNSQKVLSPISNVHAATSKLWLLSPPTAAENYVAFRSHDVAKSL